MDTVMEKLEEKELFEDYEQKSWQLTPLIYKIIGASVLFHVIVFGVVAQFDLFQAKACDSPYVGKVCQVLDAVYVSSILLGKDTAYVDKEYQNDELADADITYIDVSKMGPPFTYPEGYFQVANPEQQNSVIGPDGKPIPSDSTNPFGTNNSLPPTPSQSNDLLGTPAVTPIPNPKVQNQPLPDKPFDFGGPAPVTRTPKQPKVKQPKQRNDSPGKLPPLPGEDQVAQNGNGKPSGVKEPSKKPTPAPTPANTPTPDNTAATEYEINKRPLADLLVNVKGQVDAKTLNLLAPFSVTIDGVLTKEGKFDPKKTRFVNTQGDPKMVEVAKSSIEAMNASGYFQYLKDLTDKRLVITLQQDQNNIVAVVKSEVESEEKARRLASGFNFLISQGKVFRKGKDEATLLEQAKVTNQGKVFSINFQVPQSIAQEMIQRKFKEEETEKKPQSNSVAGYKEAVTKG